MMRIAVIAMVVLLTTGVATARKKVFYDSKSWIVQVFGDATYLKNQEMGSKIEVFPLKILVYDGEPTIVNCREVERCLNSHGYGNKVMDILTVNGTSEKVLRKLALKNKQRQDYEFGNETSRVEAGETVENLIAEQYLPVLEHNYIVVYFKYYKEVKKDGYTRTETIYHPVLYRVNVDQKQAFDIMSSLSNPQKYDRMKFKVNYATNDTLYNDIIKKAPDLAVRGVLLRRHPARINLGKNAGLKKGDLVSIYSQRMNDKGERYSKRISRARVCAVWDNEAQVNFEANTAGNRKNGDIVVVTNDHILRLGLLATYSPHIWGGRVLFDVKAGFNRSGIIHHFLYDVVEFAMTDHPGKQFTVFKKNRPNIWEDPDIDKGYRSVVTYAPWFLNFGMGYGISKTFLGFFDVMPYALAQFELGVMHSNSENELGIVATAFRFPLGLRFSFNLKYPVKIALEGGYNFNFPLGKNGKIVKQSLDYMGAKRDGIFVNLGFIF